MRKSMLGRNVSAPSIANTMPIAATGPSERLEPRSLSSRHMRPAMTVPPEASTGSITPLRAARVASAFEARRFSSSAYRAVYSSE